MLKAVNATLHWKLFKEVNPDPWSLGTSVVFASSGSFKTSCHLYIYITFNLHVPKEWQIEGMTCSDATVNETSKANTAMLMMVIQVSAGTNLICGCMQ